MKILKDWLLLWAILLGGLLYPVAGYLSFSTPYLIFAMLLLTFCRLSPRDLRFDRLHAWLLAIQIAGGLIAYGLLQYVHPVVAGGALICLLAPTATSAAVVTGMLGGDVAFLTTYTLTSSLGIALAAPVIFSFLGTHADAPFLESFRHICRQVVPLLVSPLALAWLLRFGAPRVHRRLSRWHKLSFYLWAVALVVVTARTIQFLAEQENPRYWVEIATALTALLICVLQFRVGRWLGRRYHDDPVSAGQGLGQKNTILAIWMAMTYFNPIVSVAPASYVLWQNLINSYQLWRYGRREKTVGKAPSAA